MGASAYGQRNYPLWGKASSHRYGEKSFIFCVGLPWINLGQLRNISLILEGIQRVVYGATGKQTNI